MMTDRRLGCLIDWVAIKPSVLSLRQMQAIMNWV